MHVRMILRNAAKCRRDSKLPLVVVLLFLVHTTTGCVVLAVADTAMTAAATVAKVSIKTVGAIADTVIPSNKEKDMELEK